MKCEFCGNNLGIEDEVCPACGKANSFANKHTKDMKKFKSRYDSTRDEVMENSRRFNKMTVRITTVSVLVTLITISLILLGNNYEIKKLREESRIEKNKAEYTAQLDKLIEERDYSGVYMYSSAKKLSYSDQMDEYRIICEISRSYWNYLEYSDYLFNENSYMDESEAISRLADLAESIHDYNNPSEWEKEHYYNEKTVSYINDLSDHVDVLIKGYFHISDEDMEHFWELSEARRKLLMEDGYGNEKE